MLEVTDNEFAALIGQAIDELPVEHMAAVRNVAIVYADEPTAEQRKQLRLRDGESLFGLYEGVPRSQRQGAESYLPDKITIFKLPILAHVRTPDELKAQIKHTVWHELAHYFGLDHPAIYDLENGRGKSPK